MPCVRASVASVGMGMPWASANAACMGVSEHLRQPLVRLRLVCLILRSCNMISVWRSFKAHGLLGRRPADNDDQSLFFDKCYNTSKSPGHHPSGGTPAMRWRRSFSWRRGHGISHIEGWRVWVASFRKWRSRSGGRGRVPAGLGLVESGRAMFLQGGYLPIM